MQKSELYYMAQIAVINAACIAPERKLEILRVLITDEDVAKHWEEHEADRSLEKVVAEIAEHKTVGVVE